MAQAESKIGRQGLNGKKIDAIGYLIGLQALKSGKARFNDAQLDAAFRAHLEKNRDKINMSLRGADLALIAKALVKSQVKRETDPAKKPLHALEPAEKPHQPLTQPEMQAYNTLGLKPPQAPSAQETAAEAQAETISADHYTMEEFQTVEENTYDGFEDEYAPLEAVELTVLLLEAMDDGERTPFEVARLGTIVVNLTEGEASLPASKKCLDKYQAAAGTPEEKDVLINAVGAIAKPQDIKALMPQLEAISDAAKQSGNVEDVERVAKISNDPKLEQRVAVVKKMDAFKDNGPGVPIKPQAPIVQMHLQQTLKRPKSIFDMPSVAMAPAPNFNDPAFSGNKDRA